MIGFKFKGIHSSFFKIGVRSDDRSLKPALRSNEITIPGRHGTLDYGNNTYDKRSITLSLGLVRNTNWPELRRQARDIAYWLSGKGQLVFDDEPDKAYDACAYDYVGIEQLQGLPAGTCSVAFECQPFAEDINYNQSINDFAGQEKGIETISNGTQATPCIIYIKNNSTSGLKLQNIKIIRKAEN